MREVRIFLVDDVYKCDDATSIYNAKGPDVKIYTDKDI